MVRLPRCQVVARLVGRGRKPVIQPDPDAADASKLGCPVEAIVRPSISIGTLLLPLDAQDTQLLVKGIQTYNRAICEVAKALKGADWYQRDGLMATARLLSFYEVGLTGQQSGAKALSVDKTQMLAQRGHNEGTGAMFLARRLQAFTSGAAHPLFIDAQKDNNPPLARTNGQTVPWTTHPKSVKDEVIDLGQELPAIPEQVMAFRALGRVGATKHPEMRIITPCNQLHPESETRTQTEDAGISLLHLSEIYWIALMMLYLVLDFSTERHNGHKPRGTEQSSPDFDASKCVHAIHLYLEQYHGENCGSSGLEFRHTAVLSSR
ncbi:hypothetical protein X797_003653 [Metarhizium robertsii]|uniref:Uncharacterized protein n=1 Tax=Metarhizium robertsii TaxID=568076 RepID=A0A0A1V114_9HYPO|nr:hypothetical protein X797_003653 [Metarhizium robertsii]